MAKQLITKDRIKDFFLIAKYLGHILETYLKYGDDKYLKKLNIGFTDNTDKTPFGQKVYEYVIGEVRLLDVINYELIHFMQCQPELYISYLKKEIFPQVISDLERILSIKDIEHQIFKSGKIDDMYDIFLVLNGLHTLLVNIDDLISGKISDDSALDYRLSTMSTYPEKECEEEDNEPLHNAFTWYGTPAELACLMGTLNEKGYIDAPKRSNGDRNNEGFNKMISSHIRLDDGSNKSVLNNLKDNRMTPDNLFLLAMNKLPKKR